MQVKNAFLSCDLSFFFVRPLRFLYFSHLQTDTRMILTQVDLFNNLKCIVYVSKFHVQTVKKAAKWSISP